MPYNVINLDLSNSVVFSCVYILSEKPGYTMMMCCAPPPPQVSGENKDDLKVVSAPNDTWRWFRLDKNLIFFRMPLQCWHAFPCDQISSGLLRHCGSTTTTNGIKTAVKPGVKHGNMGQSGGVENSDLKPRVVARCFRSITLSLLLTSVLIFRAPAYVQTPSSLP